MSPVVLQFANGNVFFLGMAMVICAACFALRQNGRLVRCCVTISWLIGILLVILSATPISPSLYGAWFGLVLIGLFALNQGVKNGASLRRRCISVGCTVLPSFILVLAEIPYHLTPAISISSRQTIFVIGDSITAGIGAKERPWPTVLGERTHLPVINRAQPGATVEAALKQAARIDKTGSLVIVEIGGNDLLSGADRKIFHQQLDQLLSKLSAGGNQIIMFELPLIPFHNSFGVTQRTLAKKYHAALLPKSFLTKIFAIAGGTLDGLHLSQAGHDALANEIQEILH